MRVLVTGGAGFIGSHMVWLLQDQGLTPIIVDDLTTGFRNLLPEDAPFFPVDVSDTPALKQILREQEAEAVMHFAAKTVVPESLQDPLTYYRTNSAGTLSVLEACVDVGVRTFILSSTAAVYGNATDNQLLSEAAPTLPISPYGASKLMAERVLQDCARAHGVRYAILRYFNVAGADPRGRTGQSTRQATHLIKVAAQAVLGRGPPLTVYGTDYDTPDRTCVRDYIHVSDLTAAHLSALLYLQSGGDNLLVNCGYGRGFSVLDVLSAMERAAGTPVPHTLGARRVGDAASVVADSSLLRARLSWRPQYADLDGIAADALRWETKLGASV